MAVLKLSLLGPFTAALGDQPLDSIGTTKARALLVYLAVEVARPHRREQLFTMLWPGMPERSARHNLRQVIYEIRQVYSYLSGVEVSLLLSDRQTVQLNPEINVQVDLHQMDRLLSQSKTHDHPNLVNCETCIQALEEAVDLYRGDFLADFYLDDSNHFEDWAQAVRGKTRTSMLDALSSLAEIHIENEAYEQALICIDRALSIDNLRESTHRQRLEALALSGRRVEALQHYSEYSQMLEGELEVAPSQEINALYERIRQGELLRVRPKIQPISKESSPPRHNLVPQLTPFVGRRKELAELDALLADPQVRLVTIVGPGGMGKTRLATACAERQLNPAIDDCDHCPFPDGVFFIPLADIQDPDQIPNAIAKVINRALDPGRMLEFDRGRVRQALMDLLRGLRILLVLDNFEHLLEGVGFITAVLQTAPNLQMLVTSRERLYLHGEQVFPIVGLDYPDRDSPQGSGDYTARQLFVESARRIHPGFELGRDNVGHLDRVCQLLGGMPLGLELAASWVEMYSVSEIAGEIQKGIDILETDMRDIPERHRSLRAVCDSTWNQLDAIEQEIFASLSIFRNGFTRDAAQNVTGASIRILGSLQNKSLIQYLPARQRHNVHPYLLSYGKERLKGMPEAEVSAQDRHSEFYCSLVSGQKKAFESGIIEDAINLMEADIANIRSAWDWALERDHFRLVDKMLDGICYFYDSRWQIEAAVSVCQGALTKVGGGESTPEEKDGSTPDDGLVKRLRAKINAWSGYFNVYERFYRAANLQKIPLEVDGRIDKGLILFFQGAVDSQSGDLEFAETSLEEVLTQGRETGLLWIVLRGLSFLGDLAMYAGSPHEAMEWYRQCLVESQSQGNHFGEILALRYMGWAARRMMAYEKADEYFQKSRALAEINGNTQEMISASQDLGFLALFLGNIDQACDQFSHLVEISKERGLSYQGMPIMTHVCISKWLLGDFSGAEAVILDALTASQEFTPSAQIFPMTTAAELMTMLGCYHEAQTYMDALKPLLQGKFIGSFGESRIARVHGWIALVRKDYQSAETQFKRSMDLDRISSDDEQIAWSRGGLAHAKMCQAKWEDARQQLENALKTAIKIKGFIPMIFSLPFALKYLAYRRHVITHNLYQQILESPFLGKAQLFTDLVYRDLPGEYKRTPKVIVDTSPDHREMLWVVARDVLDALKDG